VHQPDPEQVYQPLYIPDEGRQVNICEPVSRRYIDSALRHRTPYEKIVTSQVPNGKVGGSSEKFIGSDLQSRFNICNKTGCYCSKSHDMKIQSRNITNKLFNKFMLDNKLPLAELLMKLNNVYYEQIDKIIGVIENRPDHFRHEYFVLPNGRNSITELVKIFNLIENGDWKQVSLIYSGYLSQLDYSLLYETFRRSKQCTNHMNKKFCHYGINCKKGHHGVDAICFNDLFTESCKCNPNASDKILELEAEIAQLKTSEDGFTVISRERQNYLKRLSRRDY
jgi:hypothetical protein